jgi:hypothetical protein
MGDMDYRKWARAPYWSAKQCVALATGEDPDRIGVFLVLYHQDLHEKVLEAQRNKELPDRIRPIVFLEWAREHKIDFPDELEKGVSTNEVDIAQLEDRYGQLERRHDELRRDNQELRSELGRLRAAADADASRRKAVKKAVKEPSTKERNYLNKLIIGMATGGYGWPPWDSKSPVPKAIRSDLQILGLDMDEQTILDHLRASREALP